MLAFAGASVLAVAGPACAQDDAYRAAVTAALAEYDRGNYAEALVLFRQAHAAYPNARTLRGLGIVHFELRRYVEAVQYLDASLSSAENPLTEEQRRDATSLLERARAFVGRIVVTVEPDDALLTIDGVAAAGRDVSVDPGEHRVDVVEEGYETFSSLVVVDGGERRELTVWLVPLGPVDADASTERVLSTATGSGVHGGDVTGEWWFWTLIGVGVVAAVAIPVGVVFGSSGGSVTEDPIRGAFGPGGVVVALEGP